MLIPFTASMDNLRVGGPVVKEMSKSNCNGNGNGNVWCSHRILMLCLYVVDLTERKEDLVFHS